MKTFSQITIAMMTMSAVAIAQPKADKAPAPAPAPTKDAKAGAPATPPAGKDAKVAPAAPAMPTVPPELVAMAKNATGTWKCKGDAFERDGSKTAVTAVNKAKADLDKWWISESMEVKGMKMGSFKIATYTTYDATAKKWRRLGLDNWGGQMVGTADAAAEGQPMTFNLDTIGPMGAGQFRDHVDPSDMKAGLKVWGEMSMDKGKTWVKVYEMVCKK